MRRTILITLIAALALAAHAALAGSTPDKPEPIAMPTIQLTIPSFTIGVTLFAGHTFISITGAPDPPVLDFACGYPITGPFWVAGVSLAFLDTFPPATHPFIGVGFGFSYSLAIQLRLDYAGNFAPVIVVRFAF